MIGPTDAVRVTVATKPVDFRKGAEGLATLKRERMLADPFSGTVLCVPRQTRGPNQTDLLGWNGSVPVREAPGGRHLPLAEDRRRRDAFVGGAIVGPAQTYRCALNASATRD